MPIRDRILWGRANPMSDPRLAGLDQFVRDARRGRLPRSVPGGRVFANIAGDLPARPLGYYTEYDVEPNAPGRDRGKLRVVLGRGGEVFVTGNHYRDFRQILNLPS
jgi:guanyl-specific ribonuclease Sa